MNIRRKIKAPVLMHYLLLEAKYYNFKNNFYYNSQIFNNFNYFGFLIALSAVLGFYKTIFWAVGLSAFTLIIFLYFKTRRLCSGVSIQRKIPKMAREKNMLEILYTITNETAFPFSTLSFVEKFEGVQNGHFLVSPGRIIPPHTKIHYKKEIILDAGMGIKNFGAIVLNLHDDLGIFEFQVNFCNPDEIEVYPFIEEISPLKASISTDTINYGFYEISKRGDSNLFIGTREYRHGDPVKHINWKLTKKSNQVVVNEYEKNTNTYITLLLNLELENQLGYGKISTWETAKDLALSISTNEIQKNNHVQVVSNNLYIPFGSGKNQLHLMEKHFTFHEMINSTNSDYLKHLQTLPARGQIYFICPLIITPKILETVEVLKKLKMLGQEVVIFILDPFEELTKSIKGEMKLAVREIDRQERSELVLLEQQLKKVGMTIVKIKIQKENDLKKQILKEARQLVELK
ncbi:MAG: DUF58 domain-containing protein [Bdellovibrionales bacterium]|nr:DUF58 domain-containing protein [Bdellovibrionales bacterium]